MMKAFLVAAPVTGRTPLYRDQMQPWAEQHVDNSDIECYCLDAPDYLVTGENRLVPGVGGITMYQSMFKTRPGSSQF